MKIKVLSKILTKTCGPKINLFAKERGAATYGIKKTHKTYIGT
jgi:hypothetical protein